MPFLHHLLCSLHYNYSRHTHYSQEVAKIILLTMTPEYTWSHYMRARMHNYTLPPKDEIVYCTNFVIII